MTIEQRQHARRAADKRRPIYRGAMWCCYVAAIIFSYAFGNFSRYGIPLASAVSAAFVMILTAYALHFDGESRRTY